MFQRDGATNDPDIVCFENSTNDRYNDLLLPCYYGTVRASDHNGKYAVPIGVFVCLFDCIILVIGSSDPGDSFDHPNHIGFRHCFFRYIRSLYDFCEFRRSVRVTAYRTDERALSVDRAFHLVRHWPLFDIYRLFGVQVELSTPTRLVGERPVRRSARSARSAFRTKQWVSNGSYRSPICIGSSPPCAAGCCSLAQSDGKTFRRDRR